jgi:hypothetical protein
MRNYIRRKRTLLSIRAVTGLDQTGVGQKVAARGSRLDGMPVPSRYR